MAFPSLADALVALRRWESGDVGALVRACNDPEIRRRLPVPSPYTAADAAAYVDLADSGWARGDQLVFATVERSTGAIAGSVRVGRSAGGATAGYWTAPWARGRGVAGHALALVSDWAAGLGLLPLRLYIAPDNHASQHVALHAGFRPDPTGSAPDAEAEPGDLVFIKP